MMARKAEASPLLTGIYFLWRARMTGQLWPKYFMKSKFSIIFLLLPVLWFPFDHDSLKSEICTIGNLRSAPLENLVQISFSLINLWFCFEPADKLDFPNSNHIQKSIKYKIKYKVFKYISRFQYVLLCNLLLQYLKSIIVKKNIKPWYGLVRA